MSPSFNRRFGRYEILDEIGRGAMGVVYRARDPKINRIVAIKSISLGSQSAEAEADFRERFRREAEAAGRLTHPGIVTVFDVGEEPDTHDPYLVMEYVAGQSLEKLLLERGKLAADVSVRLAAELAEALDCAHGQDVVHRDLKPSNILINKDGHAKIADFGVAKLNLENLTHHGQVWGTPAFMSPEQLNDGPIDGRSDLFSLGVILYMLLTGHRPFQGNSPITISLRVVSHDPVPAIVFDPNLPSALEHVLTRALAKNPLQRYQRGMEMSVDLQNILVKHEPWSQANQQESGTRSSQGNTSGENRPYRRLRIDWAENFLRSLGRACEKGALVTRNLSSRYKLFRPLAFGVLAVVLYALIYPLHSNLQDPIPVVIVAQDHPASNSASIPTPKFADTGSAQSRPHVPQANRTARPANSLVTIQIESEPMQGKVTVWVDDRAVLHQTLSAEEGRHDGKQIVERVRVASGQHQLRVRAQGSNPFYDESHAISGDFPADGGHILRVIFNKHNEMRVALK